MAESNSASNFTHETAVSCMQLSPLEPTSDLDNDQLLGYNTQQPLHQHVFLNQATYSFSTSSTLRILICRIVISIFGIVFTGIRITQFSSLLEYCMFLTNYAWIGMNLYFIVSSYASYLALVYPPSTCSIEAVHYTASQKRLANMHRIALEILPRLFMWLYVAAHTMNWVVPPVYWIVLRQDFSQPEFTRWIIATTIMEHTLGLLFLLIDMFANRIKVSIRDAVSPILFGALYIVWVWIYHYILNLEWPYFFMDTFFNITEHTGMAVVGIISMGVIILVVVAYIKLVHLIRDWALKDLSPLTQLCDCKNDDDEERDTHLRRVGGSFADGS
ncbi:hypothetical protein BATDEDRAFT_37231 [Batrachochytrium dendrobatidis JAM81]|uniref:FAR-17a/AIG1-like protein n=1 Tax=Batrachochytrium dendrobatidis (strain JAM81 / FGSC 10211) TaxID=684364 RepID=F4P7M9_BATDJ|nr:uncharacterized protein BATDEDRAFT_37231 [Batrachochytrium dendrobatidis JAM81]EGF78634.1 hypothetical protein BATDEDRAFT_37231 [Batrachochytrium dendrobatidis JAM81]|eukprot:XP_006680804.1 hypothetical protein BATDEDRAFT_37231 [Batrachochytrium dendrobatidis JAM81]